jgi:Tfp pilus assembly protein PilO
MDKLKQWVALTVLGCLAIMAGGWFLLVSPKRGEAEQLRLDTAAQDTANATLRTQLEVLKAQAKDLPKKQADLARVAAKIPDNPGLPSLIRALTAASTSAGVEFVSVTPGTPVLVAAALPPGAAPVDPATAAAPAAAPAGAAPGAATDAAVAPVPASSAGTLSEIPLTINIVGGYFEVAQFLASIEDLPRALRVNNLTVAPGTSPTSTDKKPASTEDGRSLTSTITGSVFMAADRPAATPVVAPTAAPAN